MSDPAASVALRQARKKSILRGQGGRRVSINMPAASIADVERIRAMYPDKINNTSEAVIEALRWYARLVHR